MPNSRPLRAAAVAFVLAAALSSSARAEETSASGASYAAACQARGVPLPPPWGGPTMQWIARGWFSKTDSFTNLGADVYYYSNAAGICVMAAHDSDSNNLFDVICQGTNGKACFWEGIRSKLPPTTAVVLADPNPAVAQTYVKSGTALAALGGDACTKCHAGQNAFINHYQLAAGGGGAHPLNLRFVTGWHSTSKYDPLVANGWRQNPGPDNFPGYPASTTGCLSGGCHTTATAGGFFPALSSAIQYNYCSILKEVTNRSSAQGGMGNVTCTPWSTCPLQTDPFVGAMLDIGCQNPPSANWGLNQLMRFNASWYNPATLFTRPSTTKFIYPDTGPFFDDYMRLTPLAYTAVENGTTYNRVMFALGPNGMVSRPSLWTKGSTPTFVQTLWNGTTNQLDAWEYEGTTLRNATANVQFHPLGAAWGHRRHNGKSIIVYRGTNSMMQGLFWDGATWVYEPFPANPAGAPNDNRYLMADDPTAFKRSTSGDSFLFRPKNCANCIGEYRISSSVYYRGTMTTAKDLRFRTHPRGLRDVDGVASIFASTDGGIVWLRSNSASESTFSYTSTIVTPKMAASSPVPFYNHLNQLALVWRENVSGDHMHITTYNGSTWTDVNLTTTIGDTSEKEFILGDPAVYVSSEGRDTIIFRGGSQAVYQYELNGNQWSRTIPWN